MLQTNISGILKFLLGIFFIQVATAVIVIVALRSDSQVWLLLGLLSLILSGITAIWFTSILHTACNRTVINVKDGISKKQEQQARRIEKDKAKNKERTKPKVEVTAGPKLGAPVIGVLGVVGIGTVLLLSQIITIGLLAFSAVGGAVAGYVAGYYTHKTKQELGRWAGLGRNSTALDIRWEQSHGQAETPVNRGRKKAPITIIHQDGSVSDAPSSPPGRDLP